MNQFRRVGSLSFVFGLFIVIFIGMPFSIITYEDPALPWWLKTAILFILGGVLLVLVDLVQERRKIKPTREDLPHDADRSGILLSNCTDIPGREVTEILGLAQGHTIYAIWLGKDLSAIIRLILGGELTEYTEMMGQAREVATNRMIAKAEEMGADAIINIRFMTTSVIGSAAELLSYGTAVKLTE